MGVDLATSRYQEQDLILASGLVPVGITISPPRFPLRFEPVYIREVAPWGLLKVEDQADFEVRYLSRLDMLGIDRFLTRVEEISSAHDERGLVFLCFEPRGEFCHRHLLAVWVEGETGQHVPELAEDQLGLFV
jgi:hypothetical protein